MLASRAERGRDEVDLEPVVDRETLLAMQAACEEVHVSEPVGLYMVDVVTATRDGAVDPGRRVAARLARAAEALTLPRRARRARLRDARRRQVRRRPGPRPPPDAAPRALGAARLGRGRRARATRDRPDARSRRFDRPAHPVTRYATPKLAAYASISAVGLLTALVLARPELVALTAPFLLALCAGLALATPPRLDGRRHPRDASARSKATRCRRGSCWRLARRSTGSSCTPVCRTASSSRKGATRSALRLRAGERRELELTLRATRWGGHVIGPTYLRARDPLGLLDLGGDRRDAAGAAHVSARGRAAPDHRARRDAGVLRQRGRAHEERGDRVRRHPALDAGRHVEARQLARERAPRRSLGEREPSGAQHGRDPVRRLVRRGAPGRRGNARPRRARHRDPRGCVRAAPRPSRA